MEHDELYLSYLAKQIAITKNWIGRLEKKIWFLEETFNLKREEATLRKEHTPVAVQTDMFVG